MICHAFVAGRGEKSRCSGGKVFTNFTFPVELSSSDTGNQVAIQQGDGKIVVVGNSTTFFTTDELTLARYNTDGSLDSTFGNEGTRSPARESAKRASRRRRTFNP